MPAATDVKALARETLRRLDAQGVPPTPPNFEAFFADVARSANVPEDEIEGHLRGRVLQVPRSIEDLSGVMAAQLLHAVIRLAGEPGVLPQAPRRLLQRCMRVVDADMVDTRGGEVLDALRAAARRMMGGQTEFDIDDLLPTDPPAGGARPPTSAERRPLDRILEMVLRLVVDHGHVDASVRLALEEAIELTHEGRLLEGQRDLLNRLTQLPSAADLARVTDLRDHELTRELLGLIRAAAADSPEALQAIDHLADGLRKGETTDELTAEVRALVDRLTQYFEQVPAVRDRAGGLVGEATHSVYGLAGRSKRLSDRLAAAGDEEVWVALAKEAHEIARGAGSAAAALVRAYSKLAALELAARPERREALHDPVTALPNQLGFEVWSEKVLTAPGGAVLPCALLVGAFSSGGAAVAVARRARRILDPLDFIARTAPRELTVVVVGGSIAAGRKRAEALVKAMDAASMTIGIAAPGPHETLNRALSRARSAQAQAAAAGPGRIRTQDDLPGPKAEAHPALDPDDIERSFTPLGL